MPSTPYIRTFALGAVWFALVALTMVSRHPGHWSTYPPRNFMVLIVAWMTTALILSAVARQWQWMRSWGMLSLGTIAGSVLVMGAMLITVEVLRPSRMMPEFTSTDAMMENFAEQAAQWVRRDRGLDLDYSVESIEVIEEELARAAQEIDKENSPRGTLGLAMGYGAYIGEVFRRRSGGSWAVNHPDAGEQSYPLTTKSNVTIFPVGWCWKRLTVGEEDNVYHKAQIFATGIPEITNASAVDRQPLSIEGKRE